MTADERIEAMMALHPKGFDLSLGRITRLLAQLGDPHTKLPPVIHVAGTNGKGSTVAFCRSIAEAAGLRTHVHTSPHLVRWHERFRLNGALVEDAILSDAIDRVARANGGQPITVFELLTVSMFVLFSEVAADLCIIEVGLGGRFDATNIMETTTLSVITPVSMDHESFLGDTLEKIAFEKAGIIKQRGSVVIAPQEPAAQAVLEQQAARQRAHVLSFGEHFSAHMESGRLLVQTDTNLFDLPLPRLPGSHQCENAATAVIALQQFSKLTGLSVRHSHMEEGLKTVQWPARMQCLNRGALIDFLPTGSDLWLDGGHNPAAAVRACEFLADLEERDPRPLFLVAGMINTKDAGGYFTPFVSLAESVIAVPVPSSQAGIPAHELAEAAQTAGLAATSAHSVPEALQRLAHGREHPIRVLICGSLYLAGTVLEENGTLPD